MRLSGFGIDNNSIRIHVHRRALEENRLVFDIRSKDDTPLTRCYLSFKVCRKVVKDYFMICESYFEAIKTKTPLQIEAIDMGRRGLHNEGAEILKDHLEGIGMENPYDTGKAVTVGNANGVISFGGADHVMTFQMSYIDAEGADQKMQYVKYLKDWE